MADEPSEIDDADARKVLVVEGHDTASPLLAAVKDAAIAAVPYIGPIAVAALAAQATREFRQANARYHVDHIHRLDGHEASLTALNNAQHEPDSGITLSSDATQVAVYLAEHSKHGCEHDPTVETAHLLVTLDVDDDQLCRAIHELIDLNMIGTTDGHSSIGGFHEVFPRDELFIAVDEHLPNRFPGPAADAKALVALLAATPMHDGHILVETLANELGWTPRRMNPAIAALVCEGLVEAEPYSYGTHFHPGGVEVLPALHRRARGVV